MKSLKFIIFIYFCKSIETYTLIDKGKSYIHYRQWNASVNGTLSFKFKTFEKWGLLVYSDNSKSPNSIRNALLIKLRRARLHVTVQMGYEDYKSKKFIELGKNLDNLQWHKVKIWRNYKETRIELDNEKKFIQHDGGHDSLDLNSGLFVGGLADNISKSKHLVDRGVLTLSRFSGCIDNLEFSHSHEPRELVQPMVKMVEVKPGCLNACENVTCEHHGQCRNKFTKFYCDCKGTGYEGDRCTIEAPSISFDQNSYISIKVPNKHKTSSQTIVEFRFRTTTGDGVIFAVNDANDHFLIELQNNIIRMSWDLGGGYHVSKISDKPFNDGIWHLVQVFRYGRDTSIRVDKKYCVNSSTPGVFTKFDIRGSLLYIGGHPSKKKLSSINSESKKNFTGCLQQTYFNDINIVYKVLQIKSDRFKKYGAIKKGCNVTERKVISTREVNNPKFTDSEVGVEPSDDNKEDSPPTAKVAGLPQPVEVSDSNLSRQSIVWITVGLVIGSIILVITVGVIVHNVRYRYRAVLLSSSLKSLKDTNSLQRRFSSNDRMIRGSTDRILHGSNDRFIRASTDRLIRGSTDRIMRHSTTDRFTRGSVDRLIRSNSDRRLRGSTDRMMRCSTERGMRASNDRIMRVSMDRISHRTDRSQRGSVMGSVMGSVQNITDRNLKERPERVPLTSPEQAMDSNNGNGRVLLSDINDNEVLKSHKNLNLPPAHAL